MRLVSLRVVAAVSAVDGLYFSLTNPSSANSLLIIVGVGLLAVTAYVWFALAVRVGAYFWPASLRTQRRQALFLAGVSVLLVLMQSIGQLDWRDVLAIVPLAAAFYIYLSYRSAGS